jgi:hypothetical protein
MHACCREVPQSPVKAQQSQTGPLRHPRGDLVATPQPHSHTAAPQHHMQSTAAAAAAVYQGGTAARLRLLCRHWPCRHLSCWHLPRMYLPRSHLRCRHWSCVPTRASKWPASPLHCQGCTSPPPAAMLALAASAAAVAAGVPHAACSSPFAHCTLLAGCWQVCCAGAAQLHTAMHAAHA